MKTLVDQIADLFWDETSFGDREGLLGKGIPHAPIIAAYIRKEFGKVQELFDGKPAPEGWDTVLSISASIDNLYVWREGEGFAWGDEDTVLGFTPTLEDAVACAERYDEENSTHAEILAEMEEV